MQRFSFYVQKGRILNGSRGLAKFVIYNAVKVGEVFQWWQIGRKWSGAITDTIIRYV